MKNYFSIAIPNPCHENWNKMSPKAKGRFCDSCAKTVIDFTQMDADKIQSFINDNRENRICGHFKQSQLDSINLRIPIHLIKHPKNYYKAFLLALLVTMGTSLISCTNKHGETRKIDSVEIVDSLSKQVIEIDDLDKTCSTFSNTTQDSILKHTIDLPSLVDGMPVIETVGDIDIIEENPIAIDSVEVIELEDLGNIVFGLMIPDDDNEIVTLNGNQEITFSLDVVDNPPEFPNTPINLSKEEKRQYFINGLNDFINNNLKLDKVNTTLTGKQRISANFIVDKLGFIKNIRIWSPHISLEQLTLDVLQKLPELIPAKREGKPVNMAHTIPMIFQFED